MKIWIFRGLKAFILLIAIVFVLGFFYPPLDGCGISAEHSARLFVHNTMEAPLLKFKIDNGRFPTTEEGFEVLLHLPDSSPLWTTWKGPYLKQRPIDPWNQAFQYAFPAVRSDQPYDLWSNGPDGVPSGDDLGNWSD